MPPATHAERVHASLTRLDASRAPLWGLRFGLNPSSLHRRLTAQGTGRPSHELTFVLPLDAVVVADDRSPDAAHGVHPQLVVLERLLQPPDDGGTTLFSWGVRHIPVDVIDLLVHETLFSPSLDPLRADVEVTLRELTDARMSKPATDLDRDAQGWRQRMAELVDVPDPFTDDRH